MKYRQRNAEERSALAALRTVGMNQAEIARELGRHRSTVGRELKRNAAPHDGWYRSARAHQRAHARRYRSRRNSQFGRAEWGRVEELLKEEWSPEQVSGHPRADDHGRQRDGVPLVSTRRGGASREVLLRHAASQLGARDQRKHQRPHPTVSLKGAPMTKVTQDQCDLIAEHINNRPRKRHGYKSPNQCFFPH